MDDKRKEKQKGKKNKKTKNKKQTGEQKKKKKQNNNSTKKDQPHSQYAGAHHVSHVVLWIHAWHIGQWHTCIADNKEEEDEQQ